MSTPSWWMPDSCAKAFLPTMALLAWMMWPVKLEKMTAPTREGPKDMVKASSGLEVGGQADLRQPARHPTTSISTSMLSLDREAGMMKVLAGGSAISPGACSCQYSHSVARMSS